MLPRGLRPLATEDFFRTLPAVTLRPGILPHVTFRPTYRDSPILLRGQPTNPTSLTAHNRTSRTAARRSCHTQRR